MICFKCNIQGALKNKGYSTNRLKNEGLLAGGVITKLNKNDPMKFNMATIDKICALLNCQPGDILEYVPDADDAEIAARLAEYKASRGK